MSAVSGSAGTSAPTESDAIAVAPRVPPGVSAETTAADPLRPYLIVLAVYIGVTVTADLTGIVPNLIGKVFFIPSYVAMPLFGGWSVCAAWMWARWQVREDGQFVNGVRGWRLGWKLARSTSLPNDRLRVLTVICLTTPILLNAFGSWKSAIPTIQPFSWDSTFVAWDRAIHGTDPWRLFPGIPALTRVLDRLYRLWLPLVPLMVVWMAWRRDPETQKRFFLCFALAWIVIGNVLAVLFSSVGPCFIGLLTGDPGPYRDLWVYLDSQSPTLVARTLQAYLWQSFVTADSNPFTRISAMPSMHVALPVLYALTTWRIDRRLAACFAVYCVCILIGSVHLGWHYAVDGYVAIVGMVAIWWVVTRSLR